MSELKNKKNSRAGHKSYLSYTFSEVDKCLKDYTEDIKNEIEQWKGSVSRTTGEGYYTERPDPYIDKSGWWFNWGIYVHRGTRHQQTEVWGEVAIVHHWETASHKFAKWTTAIIPSLSAELQSIKSQGHPPQLLPFRQDCRNLKFRSLGATLVSGRSFGTPLRAQLTKIWLWPTSTNFRSCAAFWLCQHSLR